ncbi:MAG: hypothetical protein V8T36_02860 [Ruthenibacterium lactatiformans]
MNDSADTNGPAKLSAAAAEARKPDSVTPTWMVARKSDGEPR